MSSNDKIIHGYIDEQTYYKLEVTGVDQLMFTAVDKITKNHRKDKMISWDQKILPFGRGSFKKTIIDAGRSIVGMLHHNVCGECMLVLEDPKLGTFLYVGYGQFGSFRHYAKISNFNINGGIYTSRNMLIAEMDNQLFYSSINGPEITELVPIPDMGDNKVDYGIVAHPGTEYWYAVYYDMKRHHEGSTLCLFRGKDLIDTLELKFAEYKECDDEWDYTTLSPKDANKVKKYTWYGMVGMTNSVMPRLIRIKDNHDK